MAINSKKLSLYIVAGILAAVVLISGVFLSGVHLPSNTNTQNPIVYGTLVVSIKDAPVELSKLEVTIDSLELQDKDNSWINLPFIDGVESVKVDLLTLQDISQDLSTTSLPTGNYTKIRLHVKDATATYQDDSVTVLNVPSGKIDIIVHFEIKESATTNVLIDMSADSVAISNSHNLKPVIKATASTPSTVGEGETPTPTPTESATPSTNP